MRGVAGQHRAAARLRHVADEKARPAILRGGVARQLLDEVDEDRQPHWRLRESRIACQFGPSGGSCTPPAMQPRL